MLRMTRARAFVAVFTVPILLYIGSHLKDSQARQPVKPIDPLQSPGNEITTLIADPEINCTARLLPKPLPIEIGRNLWSSFYTLAQTHPPSLGEQSPAKSNVPHQFLLPFSPLSASQIRSTHASVVDALSPSWTEAFHGSGIVMFAGGPRNEFTATVLGMLRLHGTTLPVELWFRHRKSWELESKRWCQELRQKGFAVACRLLSDYVDKPATFNRKGAGHTSVLQNEDQQILASIMLSSFQHVLYLSPDAIPLANLDGVFLAPGYQSEGAVFWRDFWETKWGKWGRYVLGVGDEAVEYSDDNRGDYSTRPGLQGPERQTLDKGLFMLDKSRQWKTILLTLYHLHYPPLFGPLLSTDAPHDRLLSASLHASLLTLRQPYHVVPAGPEQIPRGAKDSTPVGSGVSVLFHAPGWLPSAGQSAEMAFLKTSIVRFGVRDLVCDRSCVDSPRGDTGTYVASDALVRGGGKLPWPLEALVGKFAYPPALWGKPQTQTQNGAQAQTQKKLRPHPRPLPRQRMIGTQVRTMGAVATRSDPLFGVLNDGVWVLSRVRLGEKGVGMENVEERIWRVLERVGCEGGGLGAVVGGGGDGGEDSGGEKGSREEKEEVSGLCRNVREFVRKAVGEKKMKAWRGCARQESE